MLIRLFFALAALLLPAQVLAQDLEGHWALRIDDATIFVFMLDRTEAGTWQGAWTRPAAIDSNGAVFRRMSGSETVSPIEGRETGNVVQLTFRGPETSTRNDVLRFALTGENQAQLHYVGIPGDPYPLVRVLADTPLGPFDAARIYDRDNAVIQTEYPEPAEVVEVMESAEEEEPAEALDPLAPLDEMEPGEAEPAADEDEMPRITADFLEGL